MIYSSGNVVVLTGETIPPAKSGARADNHVIWRVVNQIESQSFSIQSVSITGSGIIGNPYSFTVVMAK